MSGVRGGLLVVTAHPDDEVLIAGGTLAACASAGVPTGVVCLTRGEDGPISDSALVTRADLGAVRSAELAAACAELGVGWVKCYRRRDGWLRWSHGASIVRQLARVLAEARPAAVITFGEDGLYYHPDHIAVWEYTLRAVSSLTEPPALYRSVWPEELMPSLVDELRGCGLPADLWDLAPSDFGSEDREGEIVLDVSAQAVRKLRALRCHRTQLGPDHAFAAMPDELFVRFLGVERFVRVPVAGDPGDPGGLLASAFGGAEVHA